LATGLGIRLLRGTWASDRWSGVRCSLSVLFVRLHGPRIVYPDRTGKPGRSVIWSLLSVVVCLKRRLTVLTHHVDPAGAHLGRGETAYVSTGGHGGKAQRGRSCTRAAWIVLLVLGWPGGISLRGAGWRRAWRADAGLRVLTPAPGRTRPHFSCRRRRGRRTTVVTRSVAVPMGWARRSCIYWPSGGVRACGEGLPPAVVAVRQPAVRA